MDGDAQLGTISDRGAIGSGGRAPEVGQLVRVRDRYWVVSDTQASSIAADDGARAPVGRR